MNFAVFMSVTGGGVSRDGMRGSCAGCTAVPLSAAPSVCMITTSVSHR